MSITFFILAVAIVLVISILRPIFRGNGGETNVALHLNTLSKSNYTVFKNLLIKRGEYSSQIDHVVVSKYGVFVIETKDYKGTIYGGEFNYKWTQNIWGNKYELYNPILQNQGHVKALKYYLGVNDFPFIPVVTFSPRADLNINTKENVVTYYSELVPFIQSHNMVLLSDTEVERTIQMLRKLPKFTRKDTQKHVETVRNQTLKSEKAVVSGKCPRCGGTLVQRTGTYGRFYGCSNYPKCKFTCK